MEKVPIKNTNTNSLVDELGISIYSDFQRIIKGHSSKSLKVLYDKSYFTESVGSKEIAEITAVQNKLIFQ